MPSTENIFKFPAASSADFFNKFSDEDLCKICEYFEDNKNSYNSKSELFRHTLKDLFGLEYGKGLTATMCRIYNHETRTDITNRYNF